MPGGSPSKARQEGDATPGALNAASAHESASKADLHREVSEIIHNISREAHDQ